MSDRPTKPDAPSTLMHRIRVRVFALLVGTALAAIAMLSLTSLPAWPVVGVAVATVAVALNKMTARLKAPVCWGCGQDIASRSSGEYGIICPNCGTLTPKMAAARRSESNGPTASV